MENLSDCGIYQILNLINNKSYIGSSVQIRKRKNQHYNSLRCNKHHNQHLQAAWNKYGESNFVFRILERFQTNTMSKTDLKQIEKEYISKFNTISEQFGYNIDDPLTTKKREIRSQRINSRKKDKSDIEHYKLHPTLNQLPKEDKTLILSKIEKVIDTYDIFFRFSKSKKEKILICKVQKRDILDDNLFKYIYYSVTQKRFLTNNEYALYLELLKETKYKTNFYYEIEQGTSNILFKYTSLNEILIKYKDLQISKKRLENILFTKNNKHSINGKIFITDYNYDKSKVYNINGRKVIYQIDTTGNVTTEYKHVMDVIENYPNLSIEYLRKVLTSFPTKTYPFVYKEKYEKISTSSLLLKINDTNSYNIKQTDKEGNLIRTFNSPKEILNTYPQISRKQLEKILYENKKSTQGLFFQREKL